MYTMYKMYLLMGAIILLADSPLLAQPQPHQKINAPVTKNDPVCDSLQIILSNSASGFLHYRYNEKVNNNTVTYSSTLSALGFAKRSVQIGKVNNFKSSIPVTLPFYMAISNFTNEKEARLFIKNFQLKLVSCLKPSEKDTVLKPGFTYYNSFYIKQKADSFITAQLMLLSDSNAHTVIFRLFHNKGITDKGSMKNPPVVTNRNQYNEVLPLLQTLFDNSSTNFGAICDKLLVNQEWNPTFSATIKYKDFASPKVEYVTGNLWNQYTTHFYAANETIARQRFTELTAEIDKCQAAFPFQQFSAADSKPTIKWWVFKHNRSDIAGNSYKNQLILNLKKAEQGEGYVIRFEFRKSP